ncbi:polyprenol phosphomannose-dependent alpha 1,6 mannosyltransferase MptB [Corynebacterium choanae]|uniref:Alpha 1,6 mannopyranosyltransferase n=1 Tax=Corynebacterium choanae TaxID=1862358 RepID=A0A3G6J9P9_9CORY|nr:polyprenol phosphomannose-dependent alpha 1,6 mannosyltransferase MptB [Corynebacterium choanae]AZA13618.1 hypothetical protein CCHOA_06095 [Corynebacterium choanae]
MKREPGESTTNREIAAVLEVLPHLGTAGTRSAHLHVDSRVTTALPSDLASRRRIRALRLLGTIGSLLIGCGALGAGALPVTSNPYRSYPFGSLAAAMLPTATAVVLTGVGLLVIAWALLAPWCGARILPSSPAAARMTTGEVVRTAIAWMTPIALTAPMFTQDIYSYLAQGKITAIGLDPYSGGPVDLLGVADSFARSVPYIWSHSPSPYGPVALGIAAAIYQLTGTHTLLAVLAHRAISVAGWALAGWAIAHLAKRCGVVVPAALWLAILNPLTLLHLIGGIHNESYQMGLALAGVEISLRGISRIQGVFGPAAYRRGWLLFIGGGILIVAAGLVKVTGFVPLGFTGMALARSLARRRSTVPTTAAAASSDPTSPTLRHHWLAVLQAVTTQLAVLVGGIACFTILTGIPLGWITGQGGAATVRSWLSLTTAIGVIAGWVGQLAGLGDHTDPALTVTRTVGLLIAGCFVVRMLYATFRGAIHPVGAWGVSMIVVVILFPVVHPWYVLWALLPLAAWANRPAFVGTAALYCAIVSLIVLPRGLSLPIGVVAASYLTATIAWLVITACYWQVCRLPRRNALHLNA